MFLHVSVRLEAVQQLSVETESEGSVRVRWGSVSGARSYRLVWGPFTGQDKAHIKQHLTSASQYSLFIFFTNLHRRYIFVFLFTKVEM